MNIFALKLKTYLVFNMREKPKFETERIGIVGGIIFIKADP
jgi:hypothetical protein